MSPRIMFEQELELLKNQVTDMAERAEICYDKLLSAIKTYDRETLKLLLNSDRQMTDMQRNIESGCLLLLTKQQPIARDLRLVTSALKVVTDIERIGDHVTDIAELYLRMGDVYAEEQKRTGTVTGRENDSVGAPEILATMMETTKEMLLHAVEAFVNEDEDAANRVIESDDMVDEQFNQIKNAMMKAIGDQSLDADKVVDMLMVAKYLEKIGDHAVNIGEWTVFLVTGDIHGVTVY
ncbi:MAG: phosphate signaling complex protein PhoU [Lachnospiraceae bacterium]|nr:phosphate signaling complex protein PhoU [Lachnospiraceae bacterium]